jgi:hypothetical protein
MIKIDDEGFEFFVLNGLRSTLRTLRPIIVCEIVPPAYSTERLGFGLCRLQTLLQEISYEPFHLSPFRVRCDLARIGLAVTDMLLLPKELT